MRGREGGEGRRPHSVGRVFLIQPGAAGRPIIQMGNQAQTGEAQGHVSTELQRGDVITTLQTPKRLLGPRQPLPLEALLRCCISKHYILPVPTSIETHPFYSRNSCQKPPLRGLRGRKTKVGDLDLEG